MFIRAQLSAQIATFVDFLISILLSSVRTATRQGTTQKPSIANTAERNSRVTQKEKSTTKNFNH